MNREMVMASKGRPPKKIREKDGEVEYEEWIYGEPPQDVDFVRLVGDEVVRLEIMKVDGEKIVRVGERSGSRTSPLWPRVQPNLRFVRRMRPRCAAPAKKPIPLRRRRPAEPL